MLTNGNERIKKEARLCEKGGDVFSDSDERFPGYEGNTYSGPRTVWQVGLFGGVKAFTVTLFLVFRHFRGHPARAGIIAHHGGARADEGPHPRISHGISHRRLELEREASGYGGGINENRGLPVSPGSIREESLPVEKRKKTEWPIKKRKSMFLNQGSA
ncbi:hypothetical protein KM043_013283 [Ampulex compressa]|nr:hypothetical protein KM043_013283 [Ampulex compressa]